MDFLFSRFKKGDLVKRDGSDNNSESFIARVTSVESHEMTLVITEMLENSTSYAYVGKAWRAVDIFAHRYALHNPEQAVEQPRVSWVYSSNTPCPFTIGQKVEFDDGCRSDVTGVFKGINSICALVLRDDGEKGSGLDGEWYLYGETIYGLEQPAGFGLAPHDHIMGLSTELIDREAYDRFMKEL